MQTDRTIELHGLHCGTTKGRHGVSAKTRARASGPERCRAWPSPPAPASRRLGAGEEPRGALSLPHADAPVAEGGVDGESAGPNRVSHA